MLHGILRYNDEHLGVVAYQVYVNDTFDNTQFYMLNEDSSNYISYVNASYVYDKHLTFLKDMNGNPHQEGQALFEEVIQNLSSKQISADGNYVIYNPYEKNNPSTTRRLDIKKTNKYKTNITNETFCLRVASLVRYMQMSGKRDYNQNLAGTEDDHFSTERLVNVDNLGYIRYNMGIMKEFKATNAYVDIHLTEIPDNVFDVGVFKELKEKDKYGNILSTTPIVNVGFKLDSSILGFEYIPPIQKEKVNIFGMYETIEDVIANNPDKNTSWILDRDYKIVTDQELDYVMDMFYRYGGHIAFDTETSGLKINFKSRTGEADYLVGVVLSLEKGTGYYFPLQHKLFTNLCNGDHHYFMEKYMKRLLESKKIIGHNIKFDWKVAYVYDINTNFVYDTMLAFGVTKRYEMESFELSLKALVRNIFGLDMFDLSDFVLSSNFSESGITFADLPYELVRRYAPTDGDMTLSLFEFLEKEAILSKYEAQTVFDMEVNFAKAVAYAEFFGYHVEVPRIPAMREQIEGGMERHKNKMFEIAGKEFNPNSPKQLSTIMFDELGVEQIGEKRSTNKEILKTLADMTNEDGSPRYPFVVELKKYRDNEGIYKNFLKKLHEFSTPDGYIFSDTLQLGTDTGRSSANKPNYQSYNDPVKKNITPRPGFAHFDSDFSQIEYRVLASLAQQTSLMEEFDDPDLDYHTYQASRMFNIPYSTVSKALRNQSKGINFGLPYGMGDSSLGTRIFGARTKENEAKAAQLRRKFFQGQEKIEEFFEKVRSEGVARGYTKTHWGRRRYYHRGKFSVSEIRRQAGNHVIQGTAADIYKIACNRMFNRIVAEGWLGKVLLNVFVHDELLMEVHKSINMYYFFKAWREEFQLVIDGFCKLYAGAGVGKSWLEAKKQDLPPQYIEDIINKWHPEMPWDEDLDKFYKDIEDGYEEYKIRRVKDYITDTTNQGHIIKPIINSLLVEVTENIVNEIRTSEEAPILIGQYNTVLGQELIPVEGKAKMKTLKDHLSVFCFRYGIDHTQLNIKSPDEVEVVASTGDGEEAESMITFTDDEFTVEDFINMRGYYLDENTHILYFMDKPMVYDGIQTTILNYLFSRDIFKSEGRYQMALYDANTKEVMLYNAYISESSYQLLISTYNNLNATRMDFTRSGWGF